jgi:RNA polymerase sigma-70 factor (ECF subfamily)
MCDPSALRRLDDRRLVGQLRGGCAAAFAEVDRRYRPRLRAQGSRLLRGSGHDPEDLVQDTLLRAFTTLAGQDGDVELKPWLHTVQRNRALDLLRRHANRDVGLTFEPGQPRGDVAAQVLAAEDLRVAVRLVTALPPRQRTALVAHAVEGETHRSLARRMGTTEAATKLLVARARSGLRAGAAA